MQRPRSLLTLIFLIALTGCTPSTPPPPAETPLDATATPYALPTPAPDAPYAKQRHAMVENTIISRGVTETHVIEAMLATPRHHFVPDDLVDQAYADHPLPIGYGQTISQPFIVARMTELLELQRGEKVLEIGTGSGYQAAVLAELDLDLEIYSIEIVPELAEQAKARLKALGYEEIHLKQGDGYYGWPEHAPFDAIIVTAAPDHLPQPLADQLAADGRLVIPIGPPGGYQTLWRFTKEKDELTAENLGGVAFVPLTGEGH
ncbi:MAG: protein-L-isoaspartate(D-aspartate) O-methyltransferase [Anaerolineae bacterium]